MKDWLKKVTGYDKQEKKLQSIKKEVEEEENKLLKKKDPKALAAKKGEPWVNVLDVQVNKENIRNGFFELDWNKHFIEELIKEGYGEEADPEEEIVDRWFRDIVYNMLQEEGLDTNRHAGYINVIPIDKGKSEVS